jgi:two-component system sensor histidine kinase KdpD
VVIDGHFDASRGRLKIFLGYVSRVGKSFRMLDEGRRRRERGQDVVIGAIQRKTSPDLAGLVAKLPVIPMITVVHEGREYDAINVPAVLERRPQVCLIDELAYDYPPGMQYAHRWQEVEELLDNGINVVTAINLQHIREKQDAVQRITGRRWPDAVPGAFVRSADEIVMVDAPAEAAEGETAALNTRQVAELRELALLLTAGVIEDQLQRYIAAHGVEQRWGAHERIMVCLTPRTDARRMLESGWRNAERFHGDLFAVYVHQDSAPSKDVERLKEHFTLARSLGAEVHTLEGSDPVDTLLEFARRERVTQIFVGHSSHEGWTGKLRKSNLDRLIEGASDMDVRVFPQTEDA